MKKTKSKLPAEMEIYETLQIFPNARIYKTNLTKKVRNRKPWKRPDLQEIYSIIPGTVTEIMVKVGDHVAKGDKIMVYEAMKMMNIIRAPFDGTVDKIHVAQGEKLAKGTLMIYLKSDVELVVPEEDPTSIAPDPIG